MYVAEPARDATDPRNTKSSWKEVHMARKSGFIRRGNRMVRETMWVGSTETITALGSASTASIINTLGAGLLAIRPFTIVRTHGFFGIRSDQSAADESYDAALGDCVVSDEAAAIGVTAIPLPWTGLGSDLFYNHQMLMGRFEVATAVGVVPLRPWMHYQSKAMRKVNDDQDIMTVIQTSSISSGVIVHHAARALIKLH